MSTHKFNISSLIVSLFVLAMPLFSACSNKGDDDELKRLDKEAILSMSTYEKDGLDSIATLLLEKARQKDNKTYEGKANLYLSSFTSGLSDEEKKRRLNHLDIAEKIADETDNDTLFAMVYNQRGIWELADTYSPATAQYWFNRSIEKASSAGARVYSIPAEMNMSEACRIIGDTIGIRYDRELFEYATRFDEPLLRFTAGFHCAAYYSSIVNDTSELKPYIDAMRLMEKEFPGASEMVYAKFFFNKGRYIEAEDFIKKAQPDNYPDFQILHAEILNKLGKYNESDQLTEKVLPSKNSLSPTDYGKLLRIRATNMEALGNNKAAYARMMEYETFRDSIEQTKSLDLMKRYRIEYEVEAKDREIAQQSMRIRSMFFTITAIVVFVITAALVYFLWHRRQKRFYKNIVRQNREFIERHDLLENSIARREAIIAELEKKLGNLETKQQDISACEDGQKPISDEETIIDTGLSSSLSDERIEEIFDRIRHLSDNEQIWRNTGITREAFAEKVGCNRTYFSKVLKSKTGMGYSQYMNSCRIREAVRVLSDPRNTVSLKNLSTEIGFLTIKTFYAAFRQQIGMSPAAFRKAALDESTSEEYADIK